MKITIAQMNPTVGDIEGNLQKITAAASQAHKEKSDLVIFPEMFLCGYPPRDLLKRKWFVRQIESSIKSLQNISKQFPKTGLLIGAVSRNTKGSGIPLFNSSYLFSHGRLIFQKNKSLLPTYDVFDEARYFEPDPSNNFVLFKGKRLGISICEDAWNAPYVVFKKYYRIDPIAIQAKKGAQLFINISASPFHIDKEKLRFQIIQHHARKYSRPFVLVNQVGANDELIFDGRSLVVNSKGELIHISPAFKEDVTTIDLDRPRRSFSYRPQNKVASVHDALILGIRDYVKKCGFQKVVLGLSGGIDSSLVCCLAAEALGPQNVIGVSMPSPYSSRGSIEDSIKLAENLGISFKVIPISGIFQAYIQNLKEHFEGCPEDITEENIQPRIRGNILMALSNKFGYLVLSTGNKSELSVGYCTLYGDMSGGLSVIADVPKTLVYQIARFINRKKIVILKAIIKKVPTAELKFGQTDQDILPPYPVLDKILKYYIDDKLSPREIIRRGFDSKTVHWTVRAVDRNEYKRRQSPPGLKISVKAFGIGRRMPIAAKFHV